MMRTFGGFSYEKRQLEIKLFAQVAYSFVESRRRMAYNSRISALSFGDTKTAALYFDRVIPIAWSSLRADREGIFFDVPEPVPASVASELIYGRVESEYRILEYLDKYWSPFMKSVRPLIQKPLGSRDPEAYTELKELYLSDAAFADGSSLRAKFAELARKLGIPSYSVLLPNDESDASFSESYSCLALTQLPLIDTSNASWEQIMDLRSDSEAAARLRRLRLFFFENYVGKPSEYIKDDLLRRLDDYDQVRRQHGFDAVVSSISILLDSKSLQAAAVASITGALFGGPLVGLSAGAVVEVGNLAVEAFTKRAQIRNLANGHELGYLIDTKERL